MRPRYRSVLIGSAALIQPVVQVAHAEIYLTEDQALKAIFPTEKFIKKVIALTPDDIRKIEEKADERVRVPVVNAWVSEAKNVIIVDEVLGKHEFITYAVGITAKRTVQSIEIMDYRETYGFQVRNVEWRKQFVGKDSSAPLRVSKDIVNISGATLSSTHVTAGVRRVLQTYANIHDRL